jgi:hypothetical protein
MRGITDASMRLSMMIMCNHEEVSALDYIDPGERDYDHHIRLFEDCVSVVNELSTPPGPGDCML